MNKSTSNSSNVSGLWDSSAVLDQSKGDDEYVPKEGAYPSRELLSYERVKSRTEQRNAEKIDLAEKEETVALWMSLGQKEFYFELLKKLEMNTKERSTLWEKVAQLELSMASQDLRLRQLELDEEARLLGGIVDAMEWA